MSNRGHIDLREVKSVLITGAGHGIGFSLVKKSLDLSRDVKVFATYRDEKKAQPLFQLRDSGHQNLFIRQLSAHQEGMYRDLTAEVSSQVDELDVLINCIGFLHDESRRPEKRLAEIECDHLLDAFRANSVPVVLLAKHLIPLFKNSTPALFASLSARVGSISDNRSGGWYSYRSSKCAHNMLVKNIALEFERFKCNTLTLALHPGTTKTALSLPFIANTRYTLHTPDETATNLFDVIAKKGRSDNGCFFDWQGTRIEW